MNTFTRRTALKTAAAAGLGVALAACLPARGQAAANATPFSSHRDLSNSFWVGPHLFSFLAEAESTSGLYTLVEATSPPGAVVAPHKHTREDETVFMLKGEMEITINDTVSLAKPGDHFFMPRGNVHTFKMTSPTPVRVLITFTPGGLEGAYRQVGKPALRLEPPPTPPEPTPEQRARVAEIFAGYGYYIVPPTS